MQRQPRLFTHAQATELLPRVRALIERLQELKRHLTDLLRQFGALTPEMRADGFAQSAARLETSIRQHQSAMRDALSEIEAMGVEVKDIDLGLVDFPALRDGRVVYLCWKIDEPVIAYWHDLDTGFAGRQPL